jgi:hypothetical protein
MRSRFLSFALADRSGKIIGANRGFEGFIDSAGPVIDVISAS